MRIHHLNCGTMCPPFGALIGQRSSGVLGRGKLVCHCLLLETNDGLALVDTGLGTADVAHPARRLGPGFVALTAPRLLQSETALAQVHALGFRASDVRHIFVTHLDLDHAGGLVDFPDANVHVFHLEQRAALARATFMERERYRSAQWAHGPRWQLHELAGERWHGFDAVRPVPGMGDEVLLVPLHGHTRGHAGIAVKTSSGWLLHAGDAYYAHAEIHRDPARCPPGLAVFQTLMQVDGQARLHNQARLRELVRGQADVTVVCAHDPKELERCRA